MEEDRKGLIIETIRTTEQDRVNNLLILILKRLQERVGDDYRDDRGDKGDRDL